MIDLHTHILPGLDDGPPDLAGATAMARAAVASGVRVVVATPHAFGAVLNVAPEDRDEELAALRAELARLGVPLRIVPGFECRLVGDLPAVLGAQPEYLYPVAAASLAGLGPGSRPAHRYVLLELGEDMPVTCLDTMLFRLQRVRITPILAHPERHPDISRSVAAIEGFVRNGGKLQVTAAGLLGAAGWRERRVCEKLLRGGLVTLLATDAHGVEEAGRLGEALARATKLIGPAAQALVTEAPAAILGLAGSCPP